MWSTLKVIGFWNSLDNPSPSVVAAIGGAHKILSQPKRAIVAIARDSLGHESDGENSTKFGASFETPNGRRLVHQKKPFSLVLVISVLVKVSLFDTRSPLGFFFGFMSEFGRQWHSLP